MADKTAEEIEAERVAAEAAQLKADADKLTADEAARLAEEEAAKQAAKTPEQLEAERLEAEVKGRVKQPSWEEKRLAKVTADKAALAARLAQYETPDGKPKVKVDDQKPLDGDMVPRSEVERLAKEEGQRLATQAAFNAQCNAAAQEGRKTFPDFDASVAELTKLVDKSDPASRAQYDQFLEAALETGEAHKIIYSLGRDLDEASRIMGLSPVKRAQELTLIAAADAKQVSDLPKPIRTVQGKNAGPSEIAPDNPTRADNLSSAEWHRRRQAQIDANSKPYDRRQVGGRQ